tara:strand:+ start:642 stop:908 length:267 start_codon:yes stop_codon:yes gene_type:complete
MSTNNELCIKEFEKNLERIKVNETNKNISYKLDLLSNKIKDLSNKLKKNTFNNTKNSKDNNVLAAGHVNPVHNNTHIHFNNTLRSWYW